ncbi:MAG TPA: ATP-binding protein [Pyrinomonadaceae bacterium]|nr:ATP-binding protein [Pyrinomonadaceae bacterium]
MPRTREQFLPIILSFVFLLLSVIGFFSYRSSLSYQEAVQSQKESRDTLLNLDETLTLALEMGTGVTRMVINGSETHLEQYERGKREIKQKLANLHALTADDADETAQLNDLETLINKRIGAADNIIQIRRNQGFPEAAIALASNNEIGLVENIRSAIDTLKARELNLLEVHEQALDASRNRTIVILILGTIAGLISLAFANVVLISETRKRQSAEDALREANKDLEKRIAERTEELKTANEVLQQNSIEREILLLNEQSARKEAEIANRLRDEFMATVSHELRTPLNSILGWARLLKDGHLDTEQGRKAIETIVRNSETQNRLIEDLLDVARIISGKLELQHDDLNVGELLAGATGTLEPAAAAKRIHIDVHIEPAVKTSHISGDRDRLRQVFWNLFANAVKFTPNGGNIKVDAEVKDGTVEVAIADTGAGITPEFLPHVFERFRQDRSTIKRGGGLGLGLAVVRNLAEMHGGTVKAFSEGQGKGSTFTVTLPLSRNGANGESEKASG